MKVGELIDHTPFTVVNLGDVQKEVSQPFCCDLLSIAMSKAIPCSAWVTVMGNINTLAVTALTDVSCIVLAEGTVLDAVALEKAKAEEITVLSTELPIFDAALLIHQRICE